MKVNSVKRRQKPRKDLEGHQLFYQGSCIYCLAVRAAFWWLGLKVPLREIMFHPDNNAELIAGGGKSQVPCLRIGNGHGDVCWLYETIDIIRYLKSRVPG